MRKLVYDVATTLDNFIAHADGSLAGFLFDGEHVPDFLARLAGYDTVLIGPRTYAFGFPLGVVPGQRVPLYRHMRNFIFSKTLRFGPDADIVVIDRDESACIQNLKREAGTDIYLCGGGTLAGFLLDQGLIDQL